MMRAGWEWEGAWQMDLSGNVDKDGWGYASDFTLMGFPPQKVPSTQSHT